MKVTDVEVRNVSSIESITEDAYQVGSYFEIDGNLYVLSITERNVDGTGTTHNRVNLINVVSGIRWSESIEYPDDGLTKSNIDEFVGDEYDWCPVISVEIAYKL